MKMAIKQNYVIYNQKSGMSRHGGRLITVNAIGVTDRKEYITYIDPTNYNSKNWVDVISKPSGGFLVKGLNVKKDNIINADSKFQVLAETITPDPILVELHEIWKEQDEKKTANTFRDLFE